MKRIISIVLAMLLATTLVAPACAADDPFTMRLLADGKDADSVSVGDTVKVTLQLEKSAAESIDLYSIQDYIVFDPDYLRFVEDSVSVYTPPQSVNPLGSASALKFSASPIEYENRVFFNRSAQAAVNVPSAVTLVSFSLIAQKQGVTRITHDEIEIFQAVGDLAVVNAVPATVTITEKSPSGGGESDVPSGGGGESGVPGGGGGESGVPGGGGGESGVPGGGGGESSVPGGGGGESGVPGGGGGGGIAPISNPVYLPAQIENGRVTANSKTANPGDAVTITVTPDEGYKTDSVRVTDKNGKDVPVTDNGDGTYSFTMPATSVSVEPNIVKDENIPVLKTKFVDVPQGAYYYDPVYWAVDRGITDGIDATHFSPDGTCTRAQMVTFLWRYAGKPVPTGGENPFTDLKIGAYYYDAVLWAVEKGITLGTSSTTFSPDETVIRCQAMTFLWRYKGKPTPTYADNPFADVTETDYFYTPVLWAVEKGITLGTSSTTFSPKDSCLRSQVVTFLYRTDGQA